MRAADAHCDSVQCTWCTACVAQRRKEGGS